MKMPPSRTFRPNPRAINQTYESIHGSVATALPELKIKKNRGNDFHFFSTAEGSGVALRSVYGRRSGFHQNRFTLQNFIDGSNCYWSSSAPVTSTTPCKPARRA